jgi:hypothetical protein
MAEETKQELRDEIINYISKVIVGIEKYVESIMGNEYTKANEIFILLIEGFEWVDRCLIHIYKDDDIFLKELEDAYKELFAAVEVTDRVLIKDILEYEIKEIFISIKKDLETNRG